MPNENSTLLFVIARVLGPGLEAVGAELPARRRLLRDEQHRARAEIEAGLRVAAHDRRADAAGDVRNHLASRQQLEGEVQVVEQHVEVLGLEGQAEQRLHDLRRAVDVRPRRRRPRPEADRARSSRDVRRARASWTCGRMRTRRRSRRGRSCRCASSAWGSGATRDRRGRRTPCTARSGSSPSANRRRGCCTNRPSSRAPRTWRPSGVRRRRSRSASPGPGARDVLLGLVEADLLRRLERRVGRGRRRIGDRGRRRNAGRGHGPSRRRRVRRRCGRIAADRVGGLRPRGVRDEEENGRRERQARGRPPSTWTPIGNTPSRNPFQRCP